MRRFFVGITFLAVAGAITLVACNKQKQVSVPKSSTKTTVSSNTEKSTGLTDTQLIDLIQGRNPDYSKLEQIEEVLFEHCRLSSSVLHALIDETRFPDYVVEEMMVLSTPSSADLAYLMVVRPSLITNTIQSASGMDLTTSQFAIVNRNPRQVFIARNLTRSSLCPDGCGDSQWVGDDFSILDLTSVTTPLNPAEMISCNEGKWICGVSVETRIIIIDGNTSTVVTKCKKNEEKCIRKVTQTK